MWASQVVLVVKNTPASAEDVGSIPGSGRSCGGGHGNPLQYSCLENPMDRGGWWTTDHRVTKSRTQLKRLSMHTHTQRICKFNFLKRCQTFPEWLHQFAHPPRGYRSPTGSTSLTTLVFSVFFLS